MKIKHGTTRTVFLIGKLAFKFPVFTGWKLFLWGLLGNMQEREFARMRHAKMCPVVFSIPGGFLTVMQRTTPLTQELYDSMDYKAWVNEPDLRIPVENKKDSFGLLDGNIVAIDYGSDYTYE